MRRDKVAYEQENVHDDMLRDGHDVRAANLSNSDLVLVGRVQVDMVRADTGGDAKLELGCLFDELGGEVTEVEGSGDDNVGLCHT